MHNALTCIGIGGMEIYRLSHAPICIGIRLYIVFAHATLTCTNTGVAHNENNTYSNFSWDQTLHRAISTRVKGHGNALYLGRYSVRDFNSLVVLEVIG